MLGSFPEDQEAGHRLAQLYRQLGEPTKAIETLEGLINRLEQGGDPKAIDALTRTMEEYEQAIAEHEKDYRQERERAIRRLRELTADTSLKEKERGEADKLMIEEMEPLTEDAVPIINVGGLEPVFAVREEDEELKLEERDEPIHDETVAIEDERPPNLVNLLKDQELYAENPALQMFEPMPLLPSQHPMAAAASQAPPAPAQPIIASPAPPSPGQLSPVPGPNRSSSSSLSSRRPRGPSRPGRRRHLPRLRRRRHLKPSPRQHRSRKRHRNRRRRSLQAVPQPQAALQPAPSPQPQAGPPPQPPLQAQPAPQPAFQPAPSPQPPQGQPSGLSSQADAMLAMSLREAAQSQQQMADRLFSELQSLSRKIQEKAPSPARRPPRSGENRPSAAETEEPQGFPRFVPSSEGEPGEDEGPPIEEPPGGRGSPSLAGQKGEILEELPVEEGAPEGPLPPPEEELPPAEEAPSAQTPLDQPPLEEAPKAGSPSNTEDSTEQVSAPADASPAVMAEDASPPTEGSEGSEPQTGSSESGAPGTDEPETILEEVPEDAFDEEDAAEQGIAAPGEGPGQRHPRLPKKRPRRRLRRLRQAPDLPTRYERSCGTTSAACARGSTERLASPQARVLSLTILRNFPIISRRASACVLREAPSG